MLISSLKNKEDLFKEFSKNYRDFSEFYEAKIVELNKNKYIIQTNKIKNDYDYSWYSHNFRLWKDRHDVSLM